jgi:hypothetical protein
MSAGSPGVTRRRQARPCDYDRRASQSEWTLALIGRAPRPVLVLPAGPSQSREPAMVADAPAEYAGNGHAIGPGTMIARRVV